MLRSLALAAVLACAVLSACTSDTGGDDAGVTDAADAAAPPVWIPEPGVPTNEDLFGIWGRHRDDIYAVGWNGTIVHYNGIAWTKETVTSSVPLNDVHGLLRPIGEDAMPDDPIFAVGWGGTILQRATDGSGTWNPLPIQDTRGMVTSTLTQDLFGVFVGADDSALAVGDSGKVLGWNGRAWRTQQFRVPGEFTGLPIEPLGTLKSVWSNDGDSYFISGSGGAAYRTGGGFMSFQALDTTVNEPLRGLWGQGGTVFMVGLDGLILRWDGAWQRVTGNGARELPKAFFFDIDGLGFNDITVVGWRGTVARFLDGEWSVEETGTERDLRSVWIDRETEVAFAVGASGTVLRRDPPPDPDAGPLD